MAWDTLLNKDAMRGDVMDSPDMAVRVAQAKIASNAAHLLTSKEWKRLAERQYYEQQNAQMAAQNAPMVQQGLPRFTAQELAAANQPGTIPAEPKTPRMPGMGEMVEYGGVRYSGYGYNPAMQPPEGKYMVGGQLRELPRPNINIDGRSFPATTPSDEYVNKAIDYISPPVAQTQFTKQAPVSAAKVPQAPSSIFQKELMKEPVSMQTGMKTLEQLIPSLGGTPARANEAVADWMRGAAYGLGNVMRPSAWTSVPGAGNESWLTYTPEKSPAYLEQLKSRLSSLTDQTSPAAVDLKNKINSISASQSASSGVVPTDVLYRAFGVKKPSTTASQLLGGTTTPATQNEPKITVPQIGQGVSQSPYDVVAQEPDVQPEMPNMEQQATMPEVSQGQIPALNVSGIKPLDLGRYNPPKLNIAQFDQSQLMKQPSASETLGMSHALAAYKAQTQAQIDAYKAQTEASLGAYKATTTAAVEEHKAVRNAINDQLSNQLKGVQIKKAQAEAISTEIANQFAMGGPQYGTFDVGGQTKGFIRTGPKSIHVIDIKPNQTTAERNFDFRSKANTEVAKKIKSGDVESAAIMYQSLGGKPEDFQLFRNLFEETGGAKPAAGKPEQPKQLSQDQAKAILKEAGGNRDEARRIARERGFKF